MTTYFGETEPDIDDETDGVDEPDEHVERKTTPQRGLSRAAVRRIANKAQEISDTEPRIVEVASAVLGTGTGLSEMTVAIMTASRTVTAPINDLIMVSEADPMEAAVYAGALGRDRLRAVWGLLGSLNDSDTNLPASTPKAAIAVAKAVFALDDIAKAELAAVAELLKKS